MTSNSLTVIHPAGSEVSDRTWRVPEERSVAHWRHAGRGEAALEGSTERRLEGQYVIPLAAQPSATGGLHQVSPEPGPEPRYTMALLVLSSHSIIPDGALTCFVHPCTFQGEAV